MLSSTGKLYRAHSTKYLGGQTGISRNQNLQRPRRPRDMPLNIHTVLGEWFINRFGLDYRSSSLFCTGNASIAAGYIDDSKSLVTIEPIGNYSICYSSKCKDLYGHYLFYWSTTQKSAIEIMADLDSLNFIQHHNYGIELAAKSENEVMLATDYFRYTVI